ncbi:MAG: DUF3048 domain-containing protein [Coriobacteriia bacterium]
MKTRNRLLRVGLLIAILALGVSVVASGCARKTTDEISSPWPKASSEPTVTQPAGPTRWPLTGVVVEDAASVNRRPISVKIENSDASRPQIGFGSADVVYETVTEGGITRFNCIFQSTLPPTVGPVRSARLSDLWVVPQYHAIFFFSGASASVNAAVNKAGLPNMSEDAGVSYPYSRLSSRSAPHNLVLDTAKAYQEAQKRGMPIEAAIKGLDFAYTSSEATPTATVISIPFSSANKVRWAYDAASHTYLRENNGKAHVDSASGKQIGARNVVVLWATYTAASKDKVGSTTYDVDLGGSGRASIFRDGQRLDGTWKADRTSVPVFVAEDGTTIQLGVGNTWFQVVPTDVEISVQ